jgi:two-component system, sensor histidine kinase
MAHGTVLASAPAQSLSPQELDKMFVVEQVTLQCNEAGRVPLGVSGVSGVIAYGAWSHLHPIWPVVWFMVVTGLLAWRYRLARQFLRGDMTPNLMGDRLNQFSVMNGVTLGLGVMVFMRWYSLQWQLIATILLLAMVAGAMPATALRSKHYKTYAIPVIGFLSLGWAFFGRTDQAGISFVIALLCPAYLLVFTSFIKDAEEKSRIGFQMRYENARLLSELKEKQLEVIRERDVAQKASLAKSRFLASASHDLRQPLQTIAMYNAAISLRPLDDQTKNLVKSAGIATSSLTSLLNALLDVSQLDTASITANMSEVNIFGLVARLEHEFTQLALHKDIRFSTSIPRDLNIYADVILLERVLRNLLDNAFKHGANNRIELRAFRITSEAAKIEIFDDGKGIPAHEFEAIFEEFYQLKNPERDRAQGLGLGLPIVRRLCQLMNAICNVQSDSVGTTFSLEFSASHDRFESAITVKKPEVSSSILIGKKILVLDDESQVRASMGALMHGWGCVAHLAGDPESALQYLENNQYLVLLIDFRLRAGMTGLQFLESYAHLLSSTATILITGDATKEVATSAESLGVPVMRKPIDAAELRRTLEDIATP